MPKLIRGLYATDMLAVNRPSETKPRPDLGRAEPCTCSHDAAPSTVSGLDASPVFKAFDAGLKPYEQMKEISAAGLRHFGVAADSGARVGFNDRARKAWAR